MNVDVKTLCIIYICLFSPWDNKSKYRWSSYDGIKKTTFKMLLYPFNHFISTFMSFLNIFFISLCNFGTMSVFSWMEGLEGSPWLKPVKEHPLSLRLCFSISMA